MPELREQIVNPDSRTVLGTGQYVIDRQSQRISLTPSGMMIVLRQLGETLTLSMHNILTASRAKGMIKATSSSVKA